MYSDTIKLTDKKSTRLIAHRGLSGLECENTAAAFLAAGNRSYYGMETDIWRTADGQFICNHDGRTGRLCAIDLICEQSTLAELQSLILKDTDGTERCDLRMPTPHEYGRICRKYQKHAVPELKSDFTLEEIDALLKIFDDACGLDNTCFISFHMPNLERVKQLRPTQECQLLTGKWEDSLPALLAEKGMGLDIVGSEVTAERVRMCHDLGVEVNCFTIDYHADVFIECGVDYITTNILE